MPYKDPEKQRTYNREWLASRRAAWLADKCCAVCGAVADLEVDHIDSSEKVDHKVWSWSPARREAELAKCQVLCEKHHKKKSEASLDGSYKLTVQQVSDIRNLSKRGASTRKLAALFGASQAQIQRIVSHQQRKPRSATG